MDNDAKRLVELLASWRNDPSKFVREAFHPGEDRLLKEYPMPVPEDWQAEALQALVDHDKIAVKSGHGVGKALHIDTPVLTPTGWTTMKDLQPGDLVVGRNGHPTKVLGVYPQGVRDLYEVAWDDGTKVLADGEHLWSTQTANEREEAMPPQVRTTIEMAESMDAHRDDAIFFREPTYNWYGTRERPTQMSRDAIRLWRAREMKRRRGASAPSGWRKRMNHSTSKVLPVQFAEVEDPLVEPYAAGFSGDLEAMRWFEFGSVEQRAEVLRGWADNPDHTVSLNPQKPGALMYAKAEFTKADKRAKAKGLSAPHGSCMWLVTNMLRSLGGWAVNTPKAMTVFVPALVDILTERRLNSLRKVPHPDYVKSVKLAEPGPAICIKVEAEDGLFVIDGFKVTHNTTFLSWAVLWFSLTRHPFKIPCTAPAGATLMSALWPEIGKWKRRLNPSLRGMLNHTSSRLELNGSQGGSFAEARTSRQDQPEALQGFHEDNLMFVVDEASGVPDIVFQVGEGSLSTPGAKILLAGNPNRTTGYFWDAFNPRAGQRQRWWTKTVPSWDSTRVAPEWVDDMRAKYGENSPVFQIRVAGEFPEIDDFVLIPRHLIEAAVARAENLDRPRGTHTVWGVDVARQGNDKTAIAKRSGPALLEPITSWNGFDLMQSAGRIIRMFDDTPPANQPKEICIDVIGVGAGLYDRLREQGLPVTPVNVAERAHDTDRYFNRRSELWFKTKDWLSGEETSIPQDPDLEAELATPNYEITSNGKEKVEPKDDTKKRLGEGGRSPDAADALVLTFAASTKWERPAGAHEMARLAPRTEHTYDPRKW